MFFRRERPKVPTFQERLAAIKARGFTVTQRSDGGVRIQRDPCAVDIRERDGGVEWQGTAGIVTGDAIASLVDGGYQKFFRASGGRKLPATAEQLVDLHNFEEDLREAL